ncbi:MAG: single-stranded DNA-binding protein [Magnetococcales bacterium]|nr:single-stranded DNA-binding protein [Magnetococcales bacterium]NGZ26933.1 single-stranded DNA-binding protein [Magnetococcales bacterium]
MAALPSNEVILQGVVVETPILRTTPNGRSVVALEVEHHAPTESSGQQVACRLTLITLDDLAHKGKSLQPGSVVKARGRLNQRRWIRQGITRWGKMELLVDELTAITSPETNTVANPTGLPVQKS